MSHGDGPLVVLGLGNVLLGDDGVGVRVVEALGQLVERDPGAVPRGTRLLDGGTLGLGLLGSIDGARALVVVDAVNIGRLPGTVTVLDEAGLRAQSGGGTSSRGGVGALLATARLMGILPPVVSLVGIQAGSIGIGATLSPDVRAALAGAVDTVRRELELVDRMAAGRSRRAAELAGATA